MNDANRIIRDESGKIIAFDSPEGLALEVMLEKFNGRIDKMSSDIFDTKITSQENSAEIKSLSEKISEAMKSVHETMQNFHMVLKTVDTLQKANEALMLQCQANSQDSIKIKTGISVLKWIGGVVAGLATLLIAFFELFKH